MKLKNSFFYTLRQAPSDEESTSGALLVRAGFIKKTSAGIYSYLPLGYKVLSKIEQIICQEMDGIDCQQTLMPCLIPQDIYQASGRMEGFGSSVFKLKDRFDKPYALGPTHEELFAIAGSMKIKSYKDMPFSLYQMQTKFRDEPRPRFGLIRVREFIMKDAYTFDKDLAGLDAAYQKMFDAYIRIFDRLGVRYKIVRADTGIMGGLLSEEFQAITPIGEDTVVTCDSCGYASNLEITPCQKETGSADQSPLAKELIHTPNAKTIEEIAAFLHKEPSAFVKTLIYKADDKFVACLVKGSDEVNETKLAKHLKASDVVLANPEDVERLTRAKVGFAGPVGLDIPVIMDQDVSTMVNFIVGANKTDYHYVNVNLTDFTPAAVIDLRQVKEGDKCPNCGQPLHFAKGIEVGNTFKLGTKYSQAMNLYYQDENQKLQPVVMGSYGIGVGRTMAAIVEQNNDADGLIWPLAVAPYHVAIVIISTKDPQQNQAAADIYQRLTEAGVEVILDDRDERPGVKFKDMELIGIPMRITVGNKIAEGNVEFRLRTEADNQIMSVDQAVEKAIAAVNEALKH